VDKACIHATGVVPCFRNNDKPVPISVAVPKLKSGNLIAFEYVVGLMGSMGKLLKIEGHPFVSHSHRSLDGNLGIASQPAVPQG